MSGKSGLGRYVDLRRLELFVLYPLSGLLVFSLLVLWLAPAWKGFRMAGNKRAELAPLIEKARALNLKYEDVAFRELPGGEPVLWCVQNRGEQAVTAGGDSDMPLRVSNYPAMPAYSGSKHQACVPMLLLLEKKGPARPVPVFFKAAFE